MVIVNCPDVIFNGLSSVWRTGIFSDVEVLVGSQSFPSHRVILSAHSPYFQAMFTLPLKESATSQVIFNDSISSRVFESLLTFMYEGKHRGQHSTAYSIVSQQIFVLHKYLMLPQDV